MIIEFGEVGLMDDWIIVFGLSLAAGIAMPVGAAIARIERIRASAQGRSDGWPVRTDDIMLYLVTCLILKVIHSAGDRAAGCDDPREWPWQRAARPEVRGGRVRSPMARGQ